MPSPTIGWASNAMSGRYRSKSRPARPGASDLERLPDRPKDLREGEPGHRAAGPSLELPEGRRAAETAEDRQARVGGQQSADLRRGRRILELDRPGARRPERGEQDADRDHDPGRGGLVLDDQRQTGVGSDGRVEAGQGIDVAEQGRCRDHGRHGSVRARLSRRPEYRRDRRPGASDRHGNATRGRLEDRPQRRGPLVGRQAARLGHDTHRREPVDPPADRRLDEPPERPGVEPTRGVERRREDVPGPAQHGRVGGAGRRRTTWIGPVRVARHRPAMMPRSPGRGRPAAVDMTRTARATGTSRSCSVGRGWSIVVR